jgi:hypothetical protein
MTIHATPAKAPFPIEKFLKLSTAELSRRARNCAKAAPSGQCTKSVRVGLFFDGTNNNLPRDRDGERIAVPMKDGNPPKISGNGTGLPAEQRSHSNVARLFQAYAPTNAAKGFFSYYVPGVGTRFEQIGELTESSEGKAFARGGEARIIYAILQIINSVHLAVVGSNLIDDKQAGNLAKNYKATKASMASGRGNRPPNLHKAFFAPYIGKLETALRSAPKPEVQSLRIDVFGFSRGAAEAVAFCHLFDDLLRAGKFAGIPTSIEFLGIFDTVASVFLSASVSVSLPLPEIMADGHFAWADRILAPLPSSVQAGQHYIAAHEQRMNFPVTTISGKTEFKEFYFPGVHSDVGGGYGPGEGGKGRGSQANMLSQIPLAYMYKAALVQGVPLRPFEELDPTVKEDFLVSSKLAHAWERYCAALINKGD